MAETVKEYVSYIALFVTTAGWIGNSMVLQSDLRHLVEQNEALEAKVSEKIKDATKDRFHGYQGAELARRITKLETELPPAWLLKEVAELSAEVHRLDDKYDGQAAKIAILNDRTKQIREYLQSKGWDK